MTATTPASENILPSQDVPAPKEKKKIEVHNYEKRFAVIYLPPRRPQLRADCLGEQAKKQWCKYLK